MSIKILLLEDDTLFAETLIDLFESENFEVIHSSNGQDALDAIYKAKFDLYILDINVPLINGLSLLRELRESNDKTPAIFLTSNKTKETLKSGFINGADDYITKPFDNIELLLRINALLRRTRSCKIETVGKLKHDKIHKSISLNGINLELSKKEYNLLVILMKYANKNVTKEIIYNELWNHSEAGSDGAIRVYINRLKQLLVGMKIENIHGIGYKLVC